MKSPSPRPDLAPRPRRAARPPSRWLAFAALSALLALPSIGAAAEPTVAPLLDLDVTWDGALTRGAPASLEVAAFAAHDVDDRRPVAAELTLALRAADGEGAERVVWRGRTGADGRAAPRFAVPPDVVGARQLVVRGQAALGAGAAPQTAEAVRDITIRDATTLSLRFDRTLYQPGHTVRWRLAALGLVDAHPLARAPITVTIRDPRRTAVWRGTVTTDARGLASGELPLADELLTGDYTIEARADAARADATFTVRPFTLPPFLVTLDLDHAALAAGRRATGLITARTAYGEPVRGTVTAELRLPSGPTVSLIRGALADAGSAPFDAPLPDGAAGPATVHVSVTDGAARRVDKVEATRVGAPQLSLSLVSDAGVLIAGREHRFHLITTDESGELVAARIAFSLTTGAGDVIERDVTSDGVAVVTLPVPEGERHQSTLTAGELVSWDLTAARPVTEEASRAVEAALARRLDSVARCNPDEATVLVGAERDGWRVRSVTTLPFAERPELPFAVHPDRLRCVSGALLPGLPPPPPGGAELRFVVRAVTTPRSDVRAVRSATVNAAAATPDGRVASVSRAFSVRPPGDPTQQAYADPAVVAPGVPIEVRAPWPDDSDAPIVATLLRRGTPVATATCRRGADGQVVAELVAPEGTFGLATVRLHQAAWTRAAPRPVDRVGATTVFLRPPRLEVELAAIGRVRPGAESALDVTVRDAHGDPVADVGLAAAVVDERVLALSSPQAELSDVLARDDLEAIGERARLFSRLLASPDADGRTDAIMRALLDSLPRSAAPPRADHQGRARLEAELAITHEARVVAIDALTRRVGAVVVGEPGQRAVVVTLDDLLRAARWDDGRRTDPWGRIRTWERLAALHPSWVADTWAYWVTRERLDALIDRLEPRAPSILARLGRDGAVDPARFLSARSRHLATDGWGQPFRLEGDRAAGVLRSAGPDGRFDTDDDLRAYQSLYPPSRWRGGSGHAYGGMGMTGRGAGGGGRATIQMGAGIVTAEPEVAALRERFDETALWLIGETTDADGRARFPFTFPDSVTGWDVRVEAIGARGALGLGRARVETYLPLHVELMTPARLTVGDRHEVAAVVANHEAQTARFDVTLSAEGGVSRDGLAHQTIEVPAGAVRAARFMVRAESPVDGRLEVTLRDAEGRARDAMARSVRVVGPGLEVTRVAPGRIRGGRGEAALTLPEEADPATVAGRLRVFRGVADQALDGLESLLREPTGCFEQTTATSWPNLLVMRVLRDQPGRQALVARASELVARGYQQLLRYEVRGGGFSYWGDAPASVALTAMGLAQFHDMAQVYPVDPALLERTRTWLTTRQRADGSWPSDASRWSQPEPLQTTAWVTWSLAQTGEAQRAVTRGLAHLRRARARMVDDPYALALWAAAEARAGGRPDVPLRLLDAHRVGDAQRASYEPRRPNLLHGRGRAAAIEATAIAATARLMAGGDADAELAWLWEARSPRFGWGSTQGTVHALRAAALAEGEVPGEGQITVRLDGRPLGTLDLADPNVPSLELPAGLAPGRHVLELEGPSGVGLRTDLRVSWREREAPEPAVAGLGVHLVAPDEHLRVGDLAPMRVAVVNRATEPVAMPTVVVPIPPGFRPDPDSLAELKRDTPVTRVDDLGDRLAFYLEALGPGEGLVLPYRLEAMAPCDVAQAPAEAFAYYDPDVRGHSGASRLVVRGRTSEPARAGSLPPSSTASTAVGAAPKR